MLFLKENYKDLKIHTQIILTNNFINKVLNNTFNIIQFQNFYNTRIDYIQPMLNLIIKDKKQCIEKLPDFLPLEQNFIRFLYKTCIYNKIIDINILLSPEIRSNILYYFQNNKIKVLKDRRKDKYSNQKILGHFKNIGFSNSSNTMIDIIEKIKSVQL